MSELDRLGQEKYVLLTTYRKDGRAVPTPVWAARDGDELLVWSAMDTGKVKRIRREGAIELAGCDRRGTPHGDSVRGQARLLDTADAPRALNAVGHKYGVLGRILVWASRLRRGLTGVAAIAITLEQQPAPREG
ncbi:MAG TPA: PPOX class F420-dependent oxidoreductase [Pseudonocardiaceae bacterium]|jgi:hypothetical protein|nr:PPOX class F420-dependent oxidoreductase [Pseudonocardiaceae bacterium]